MSDLLQKEIEELTAASRIRGVSNIAVASIGTSIGQVRAENQDRAVFVESEHRITSQQNYRLAILADGMGGLLDGGLAADIAVSHFISVFHRSYALGAEQRILKAADAANRAVFARLNGKGGSTLVAVYVDNESAAFAISVGDSRVYLLTDTNELLQVSRDDTIGEVLKARSNDIDPYFDQRLIQFVGMGDGVESHIYKLDAKRSKSFLLTSDGVHGVGNDVLTRLLSMRGDRSGLVESLLAMSNAFGGHDNATAVLMPLAGYQPLGGKRDRLSVYVNYGELAFGPIPQSDSLLDESGSVSSLGEMAEPTKLKPAAKKATTGKKSTRKKTKKKQVVEKGPGELKFDFSGDAK